MSNPKVFEFAKEIGMTPLALMDKIKEWQLPVRSHMAELEPEVMEQIKSRLNQGSKAEDTKKKAVRKASPKKAASDVGAAIAKPQTANSPVAKKKVAPVAAKVDDKIATPASGTTVVRKRPAQSASFSENLDKPVIEDVVPPVSAKISIQTAAPLTEALEPTANLEPAKDIVVGSNTTEPVPTPHQEDRTELVKQPARKKEVLVGTSGVASAATPVATVGKRNIIGRMDLNRVQSPNAGPRGPGYGAGGGYQGNSPRRPGGPSGSTGQGFAGGAQRTGAGRNIRAGFVAAAPMEIPLVDEAGDFGKNKKFGDKKVKKLESSPGAATKERELEEFASFNAVEFRKRELVFQPKKKKGMLAREALATQITTPKASKRIVKIYGKMKLADLANEIGVKAAQLTKALLSNGVNATMNTDLDFDTIALIVPDFGWEAQNIQKSAEEVAVDMAFGDLNATPVHRPPVVTVMGHVDHGKTSLLDAIRKSDVAAGEAGGITQHIGAYSVKLEDGHLITFLDTPGHEAFTAMRARGANVTDIAVIVVAADDGLMPQTAEAINHARAAKVPIIVAVNKMDKPGAQMDRIKQQLTEFELVPEEWGGSTIFAPVSALKKTGIKELLEHIKLVAEMQDLKANPSRSATGIVIESKLEKGRGPVATILIKDGSIKVGQHLVAGKSTGRVRSLINDKGERVESAGPGMPVEILGLNSAPMAGDRFDVVINETVAERMAQLRQELIEKQENLDGKKLSLEDLFSKVQKGDMKELGIVLKADVQGSLEALLGMLGKLVTAEVKTKIIHSAVGGISESDVLLAHTAKGLILGFGVRPDGAAQAKAKQLGVEIRTYSIIYELIDEIKKAMAGLLTPDVTEKVVGRAEVRNIFTVPKMGTIAGCFIADGKIQRSNMLRLVRDGKIIYEGKVGSLRRFKDDAKEVASGFECGIGIENFNDIKVGDSIEAFVKEESVKELKFESNPN